MDQHTDHKAGSDLKTGLIGLGVAVVGLLVVMAVAHFMAL